MSAAPPPFEFATATRIICGPGAADGLAEATAGWGRRALMVTGRDPARHAPLRAALAAAGVTVEPFAVGGEPTAADADRGAAVARATGAEFVVAIGGGSALDAGKAVAALATNRGGALDYLEVVGRGQPLTAPPLPVAALPTTAGTGAEVTRNAVLGVPEHGVKASLRSPLMLPRLALVDPHLALGLPPAATAATGLDALAQLIEPYVSKKANPLTDALCAAGIPLVARALRQACRVGTDRLARHDLAVASLFGGLALANAGLGAVHGLAAPLGGMFPAPHGAVCAALLPHVMAANIAWARTAGTGTGTGTGTVAAAGGGGGGPPVLARYRAVARLLTGRPEADPDDGVAWVAELVRDLGIPGLAHWGVTGDALAAIAAKGAAASSMKANPFPLGSEWLTGILAAGLNP